MDVCDGARLIWEHTP